MTQAVRDFYLENLGEGWFKSLQHFLETDEMEKIRLSVLKARKITNVYPSAKNMFRAFQLTPLEEVKVVILGMDPYHTPKHATGVAFSSGVDYPRPPSLTNILKEVEDDYYKGLNLEIDYKYCLDDWAAQGVLLINTALTVEQSKPGSHTALWQPFTIEVMKVLQQKTGIIYLLWGNHAKQFKKWIFNSNHILEAVHPSPLSAHGGFFGCKHFTKTNEILEQMNGKEFKIKW